MTEIDSLQIQIESNSTGAAQGIDALARSLGELKKNGTVNVAIKNLNSLSIALKNFTDASNAARSVGRLVGALGKLKEVGSVASVGNSLTKLSASLKSLNTVNIDRVGPQIKEIAAAVSPLSEVKAGGLSSMVNAMAKIGKVTADLDDDKIAAFAERVERLNAELTPLSQKMTTISAGFKAINSGARSAGSGVKKMSDDVDAASINMSSFIYTIQEAIDWLQQAIQKFSEFMGAAIEWDGIAARFGRGFGTQAQETYEWIQRLNEEMGINVQQFMKYSSVYATMLTGFGVAVEDATKMALGYTELTYDIWAGYNDIYKNFDDAAEAVKSAIAGEVEPIRRAGFTIVESTLEQTAANHGLEISLYNATEAQKSYLRYLTLVDQAHAQGLVGTYAKELNTAEGLMRTFSQQLKSLTQSFGSLFLPVLVRVMPYLQAFVELLTEGVQALAALFGIEIMGVDWSGYNAGVGDAIENTEGLGGAIGDAAEAAKELKSATVGIDELNIISPPSASGGAGGAGGAGGGGGFDNLDVDSLWDESIFKDINSQVDAIKEKLEGWLPAIAAVGGAFGALGMALLLANMGEALEKLRLMDGHVATLKKALAGLAILTIEAVLVFMFADEFLESGNLLPFIGEVLATAAGGYLMYKGFGTKGLVMSLAVSFAAQLVAITMNLADGGVEIDDPQLWLQTGFSALTAAAGGLFAFKGVAGIGAQKGAILGATLGLSLSLAAITIGEVAANGEVTKASIFTGIGSVLAAAGFGFTIGGPWGAAIGAAVGLGINIIGAVVASVSKDAEKSLEEDLTNRFGSIELDGEGIEVYVDKITAIPREVKIDTDGLSVSVSAALDIYATEAEALENIKSSFETIQGKLDAQNVKIAIGVGVDYEDYAANIDAFVNTAQNYLDQHYLTTNIAVDILNGDADGSLSSTLASFYAANSEKLSQLGAALKNAVSDAFVDGEWIPDKLQAALELQKEIQEIVDYVAEVEYRATMQNLKLSVSGDMLSPESFKDVLKGAKDAIETRLNNLEEVKMANLQVAVMEYDANIDAGMSEAEAKKIYDMTVADIEEAYQNGRVEVSYGTVDFGITTLHEAFSAELEKARGEGWFDFKKEFEDAEKLDLSDWVTVSDGSEVYSKIDRVVTGVYNQMSFNAATLSAEARKNLEEMLEQLEPTMADYNEIAAANRKSGVTVTQSVRDGLNDYNELKALSGDVDAINYLIGVGFSSDTTFLNTLATVEGAGKEIDASVAKGLLNNITYVTDEATGVVTGIKNAVTGEVIAVTPTLVSNMEQLGVELSTGVLTGAETQMTSQKKSWKDWAIWPWNWFKEENEIHSPSKVFERGGKAIVDGLIKGITTNSLRDRLSTVWTNAKTWWDKKKGNLKTYTPSIGSIYEKLKDRWDNARTWWNNKKTKAKEYTPSIGSIYEKLSERWNNARTWWNNKKAGLKAYTPSIGSIKDRLSSAWNTAKNWWNKNVKLSIPSLKFKVTYSKPEGKTMRAIMDALDLPGWPKLSFAANGGIFDAGSLIWAGERGPEVMATAAGGKTGVMNIQQMQEAVYEGVYAAVMAANRASSGGGSGSVNVYLDGRQVTAVVEKRQRERGANIMGNQVYSNG